MNSKKIKDINQQDALTFLLEKSKMSLDDLTAEMNKKEKEKIIRNHPYQITEGKDHRWRTYIKTEEGRKQIAKSSYEKVVEALVEFYLTGDKEVIHTIESLYPVWCEYKKLHCAASSYMTRINNDWKSYYLGTDIVKMPIEKLDKLTLDVWAHHLIEQVKHQKKAYMNASIIMRQILDYAVDAELIPENLFRKIKINNKMVFEPVRKKASETQVFSQEEMQQIYDCAWRDFYKEKSRISKLAFLAIMFQFETGMRLCELVTVKYEDIEENEICIKRMYRFQEKEIVNYLKAHHSERTIPLTNTAIKLIETAREYQIKNGYMSDKFIFSIDEDPLSYYSMRRLYIKYCDEIGTVRKSSHKARKTFVSALIDGGVNINTIREIVGHVDEKTTLASYCFDRKSKPERAIMIEEALTGKCNQM